MPAYSPKGLFVGLSQSELDDLRAGAIARMNGGQRTSISGGAKSGSKEYPMPPDQVLAEVIYAEQQNGTRAPRNQKVYQVMNCQYPIRRRYV